MQKAARQGAVYDRSDIRLSYALQELNPLTLLPNRQAFLRVFTENFVLRRPAGQRHAILIDIDQLIWQFAKTLQLSLVVEGMEEKVQLEEVHKLGDCLVQGFLYHRALPSLAFLHMLDSAKKQPISP